MTRLPAAAAAAMLLAMSAALACGEEDRMQASIQDVRQRHAERLMALPGVVSVGIGRDQQGRAVIVVGLDRERPETRQQLPERLEGYALRTEVIGEIKAQ